MAEYLFLVRAELPRLLEVLRAVGFSCIGPRLREGAIVYAPLESAQELPHGVQQRQGPAAYHTELSASPRCFAWANGPQALKPYTFAPREELWTSAVVGTDLQFNTAPVHEQPLAIIGVRACDLAALQLQDRHFLQRDRHYTARRERLLLVAVNCSHPAATCFCASTGDGPEATSGFDLVLDELDEGFVVRSGSPLGGNILRQLSLPAASDSQRAAARTQNGTAAAGQTRQLPGHNLHDFLFERLEHPQWAEIATRCLSCGNCTAVCPTCFCHSEQDMPELNGRKSVHYRQWDSCFSEGHSYMHGIVVRADTRLRYRQWLTHKLGGWHEQFGRSGCVGCGRCIAWCPAGIDITYEVERLAQQTAQ